MSPVGISASYSQKGWQLLSKGAGMRELAKGDILVKEDFTVSDCKLLFLKKVDIYSWLFCCSETNFKVCVGWFPHQQSKLQIPACGLSVQFSSVSQSCPIFVTPWITACQTSLSITNSQSSLKLMSIESVMPSSHLILFIPFFSCPQSLLASGSFPMSKLFSWGGQSTGVSASASVLPMNTQDWSPLG